MQCMTSGWKVFSCYAPMQLWLLQVSICLWEKYFLEGPLQWRLFGFWPQQLEDHGFQITSMLMIFINQSLLSSAQNCPKIIRRKFNFANQARWFLCAVSLCWAMVQALVQATTINRIFWWSCNLAVCFKQVYEPLSKNSIWIFNFANNIRSLLMFIEIEL